MNDLLKETVFMDLVSIDSDLSIQEIDYLKNIFSRVENPDTAYTGDDPIESKDLDELKKTRRSKIIWLDRETTHQFQVKEITEKIIRKVSQTNKDFFDFDLLTTEDLQLTQYDASEQGFYKLHTDSTLMSQNLVRKLSFVLQLSDLDEFEGGEFICIRGETETNVSTTNKDFVKKGKILVFPSFMAHGVTPVTAGTRYSLVGWCIGPRFR